MIKCVAMTGKPACLQEVSLVGQALCRRLNKHSPSKIPVIITGLSALVSLKGSSERSVYQYSPLAVLYVLESPLEGLRKHNVCD